MIGSHQPQIAATARVTIPPSFLLMAMTALAPLLAQARGSDQFGNAAACGKALDAARRALNQ